MTRPAHTATPWVAEPGAKRGAWIKGATGEWSALACGDTDESAAANAALIVRAVNCHDELVKALEDVLSFMEDNYNESETDEGVCAREEPLCSACQSNGCIQLKCVTARAILARAKEPRP